MEQAIVSGITIDDSESKLTLAGVDDRPGIAASLFRTLADEGVNVDMIVQNTSDQGHTDISFTVPNEQIEAAEQICQGVSDDLGASGIRRDDEIGRVSVIGAGMKSNPGVAATMFEVLAANDINIQMISTSAIRISCVVDVAGLERANQVLHEAFVSVE